MNSDTQIHTASLINLLGVVGKQIHIAEYKMTWIWKTDNADMLFTFKTLFEKYATYY